MALYSYRAVDNLGKSHKGLQDAANQVDLELRLKRGGLDLIDAKLDSGGAGFGRNKIKRPELITFFFNLEQLTRAGVPLLESLADLRDTMNLSLIHISEPTRQAEISYAVFCLKKKK